MLRTILVVGYWKIPQRFWYNFSEIFRAEFKYPLYSNLFDDENNIYSTIGICSDESYSHGPFNTRKRICTKG